jgi:peptide/nickel transport system ATP-binding protein
MPLLEIDDLVTQYRTKGGDVHAVDGVSLQLDRNETLGLVGESGSGKTTIARSINRILPDNGHVVDGAIRYDGVDLTDLSEKELRRYRWRDIAYVPQSAMNAFDPVYTVGAQIVEVIRAHEDVSKAEARERSRELFEFVDLDPERVDDYPHQFSGGMRQRAAIALALALDPPVILADEPTTALDVIIQDQILTRIAELQSDIDSAMVLITHDISVVSETCDTTAVVYAGRVVEYGDTAQVITDPKHPYTMGLRNAFPTIDAGSQDLISIPGSPPELVDPDEGCRFADRCPFAVDECRDETPEREEIEPGHYVECHRADEYEQLQREAASRSTWQATAADGGAGEAPPDTTGESGTEGRDE